MTGARCRVHQTGAVRLIACDLDGTLLGPDAQVSTRSVAALRAAHAAGVYVVIASGRPPFMLDPVLPVVGEAVTHGVLANGSLVCTLPDGAELRRVRFDLEVAVDVVRRLRDLDPRYGFALATDAGWAQEQGFFERMPVGRMAPDCADALDAAAGATEALKLMAFHDGHSAHQLLDLLPPLLGPELAVTHMGADCVEIGPTGIDKGTGLAWLCAHLGVDPADVVAFGDEYNDHEMLRFAGHGVVMANANELTRALADEIAPSNADDGVAVVIERLLAERR
jgi:Cof subfamily protein (haloacid dehalogenase superfamily)